MKKKRIVLSLDGGGIRGAATAQFLKRIEENLSSPLHEICDLFAGTSTGGIIAVLLGCRQMSAADIAEVYNYQNSNKIMNKSRWDKLFGLIQWKPKYNGKGKREVLKKFCGEGLLDDASKPTLLVTYNIVSRRSRVLKSTRNNRIPAYLAADASSAAPTYFPSVMLSMSDPKSDQQSEEWLIDGGVVANNPALCAYSEALVHWPDDEIIVISIGTGGITNSIDGPSSQNFGPLGWMKNDFIGVTMDESVVEYQMGQLLPEERYIRINSTLPKGKDASFTVSDQMDLCTQENIDNLKKLGDQWFDDFGEKVISLLS